MLSAMTSTSDRLAAQFDRLPRGARAGLLAVSVAAAFVVAGGGAQASPVKGGPTVFLDGPGPSASDPVFDFKSPDATSSSAASTTPTTRPASSRSCWT